MRAIGKAQAKLILFGEHAAVYGHPAIGLALPQILSITLSPANKMQWTTLNLEPKHTDKLNTLLQYLPNVFPEMSSKPPIEIGIEAESPIGVGLGSSGALCVALTRSLFSYLSLERKYETEKDKLFAVWKYAHELEKVFHHTPSGIDTALSTFGQLCYFKGQENNLPKYHPMIEKKIPIVIGALPRNSDTGSLVTNLRNKKDKNSTVKNQVNELGKIATEAIEVITMQHTNVVEIGRLANTAQQHLAALGLSTFALDEMIKVGLSLGATGGKLSGAGGGGAYYLVAQSEAHAKKMTEGLNNHAKKNAIHHLISPMII